MTSKTTKTAPDAGQGIEGSNQSIPTKEYLMNNSVSDATGNEQIHVHGWCAAFCEDKGDNPSGGSTEHPSFCRSTLRGGMNLRATESSKPMKAWMTLIKPYFNGWVDHQEYLAEVSDNETSVQMEIQSYGGAFEIDLSQPSHPTLCIKMTPSEARTMAAHLTWFADNADRLTEDLVAFNRKRVS